MLSRVWAAPAMLYITFVGLPSCDLSIIDPVPCYSGVSESSTDGPAADICMQNGTVSPIFERFKHRRSPKPSIQARNQDRQSNFRAFCALTVPDAPCTARNLPSSWAMLSRVWALDAQGIRRDASYGNYPMKSSGISCFAGAA